MSLILYSLHQFFWDTTCSLIINRTYRYILANEVYIDINYNTIHKTMMQECITDRTTHKRQSPHALFVNLLRQRSEQCCGDSRKREALFSLHELCS